MGINGKKNSRNLPPSHFSKLRDCRIQNIILLINDNDNIKSLEAMKKWKPKLKNIQHKEWNKEKENFELLKTKP
jgi:hypothetical protein